MRERPILFSGPMVRAIIDGRKTQTRRVVTNAMPEGMDEFFAWFGGELRSAPNGCAPDGLWARGLRGIAHVAACPFGSLGDRLWVRETWYPAPDSTVHTPKAVYLATVENGQHPPRWRPSIHMPRWASRITLEVVNVRVERLADISEADAKAEGYTSASEFLGAPWACSVGPNPWVWVVEFKRVEGGK